MNKQSKEFVVMLALCGETFSSEDWYAALEKITGESSHASSKYTEVIHGVEGPNSSLRWFDTLEADKYKLEEYIIREALE